MISHWACKNEAKAKLEKQVVVLASDHFKEKFSHPIPEESQM